MGGHAVTTMRIAGCDNKHIGWKRLCGGEKVELEENKEEEEEERVDECSSKISKLVVTFPSRVLSTMISLNSPGQEEVLTSSRNA